MEGSEILLEAGTNELEVVEFLLDGDHYGTNAAKVRTIRKFDPDEITWIPNAADSVLGLLNLRNQTIPLVDLRRHLGMSGVTAEEADEPRIVMICSFNRVTTGFLVDAVQRIYRISWDSLRPLPPFLRRFGVRVTATTDLDGHLTQVVDLEHVVADLSPKNALQFGEAAASVDQLERRGQVKVMLAEDSAHVRERMVKTLRESGYTDLVEFDNGDEPFRRIEKAVAAGHVSDLVHVLVSDIEMPRMDGLTLCRRVKKDLGLDQIRVILFSSLIDEQMAYKCMEVGADGYVSKPEGVELVALLDEEGGLVSPRA